MSGSYFTVVGNRAIVCKTKCIGVNFVLIGAIVRGNIYYPHRWSIDGKSYSGNTGLDLLITKEKKNG